MRTMLTTVALLAAAAIGAPRAAHALPPGFRDTLVVGGLDYPTGMCFAPDGRVFVAEIAGAVRVIEGGALVGAPVLSLAVETFLEQGVLGLALHPAFPDSAWLYVFHTPYTGESQGNQNRVSRFLLAGNVADPGSEQVVLDGIPAGQGFHVAGDLHFAPDGNLFISTGEAGSAPDPPALQESDLRGKLLRVTPTGAIPPDNPYYGLGWARGEVYYRGLRNPFRFAVQPGTGQPFVCDVGESSFEEIDTGPPGSSFGWPDYEGPQDPDPPDHVNPWFSYPWGTGAAITGAAFYGTGPFPAQYWGDLFFTDHVRGEIGRIELDGANQVANVTFPWGQTSAGGWYAGPISLVPGPDGALYYTNYMPGEVRRIEYVASAGVGGPSHRGFALAPAAPNPFARATTLAFALPAAGRATLAIHDVAGRRVRVLADGELPAGPHAVRWDGRTDGGALAAPGVYLAVLETAAGRLATRVVRVR